MFSLADMQARLACVSTPGLYMVVLHRLAQVQYQPGKAVLLSLADVPEPAWYTDTGQPGIVVLHCLAQTQHQPAAGNTVLFRLARKLAPTCRMRSAPPADIEVHSLAHALVTARHYGSDQPGKRA